MCPRTLFRLVPTDYRAQFSGFTVLHVSCDQAALCVSVPCDCNAWQAPDPIHGCTINDPGLGETRFDLTANGDALSGTLVLSDGVEAVHLTRAP